MTVYPISYFKLFLAIFFGVFFALLATFLFALMIMVVAANTSSKDMLELFNHQRSIVAKEPFEQHMIDKGREAQKQYQLQKAQMEQEAKWREEREKEQRIERLETQQQKSAQLQQEKRKRAKKSAQESCNYWVDQYRKENSSYNKVWRDTACDRARKL